METLTVNLNAGIRRETLNNRAYLVAPLTMIVEGVLPGSKGSLYYPPEEIARDPTIWNGMPITNGHPYASDGKRISARSPKVLQEQQIGTVFNTSFSGKLVAEGWFDVEKTSQIAPEIITNLLRRKPMELSTGLFVTMTEVENGDFNGTPFTHIASNFRADHLAVLLDQSGACSLKDGCGVLVNSRSILELIENYNPSQPRDSQGRWGAGGSSGGGGSSSTGGFDDEEDLTRKMQAAGIDTMGESVSAKQSVMNPNVETDNPVKKIIPQLQNNPSSIEIAKAISEAKKQGPNALADVLEQVDSKKGAMALREVASDYGISLQKNPGGKGTDVATSYEIKRRILEKFQSTTPTSAPVFKGVIHNQKGENSMPLTKEKREEKINRLVHNCRCQEEDREIFNVMSDESLLSLDSLYEDNTNLALVANAAVTGFQTPVGQYSYNPTEKKWDLVPVSPVENQKGTKVEQPKTAVEWLDTAPSEIREVVENAMQIQHKEKEALVRQLIVNVAEDKKQEIGEKFMKKGMGELQELVSLLPVENTSSVRRAINIATPNFTESPKVQAVQSQDVLTENERSDVLEMPSLDLQSPVIANWYERRSGKTA